MTDELQDSQTPILTDSPGIAYLNRSQMAKRLGVEVHILRNYCKLDIADSHFGAIDKGRGNIVYPESSAELFRQALEYQPSVFESMIKKVQSGGAILPPVASRSVAVVPSVPPESVRVSPVSSNSETHELTRSFHALANALTSRVPIADDYLMGAEESRKKLGGSIPKSLRPVATKPNRWSNNQINEYIARLRNSETHRLT